MIFEYREGLFPGERYELTISSQMPFDLFINPVSAENNYSIEPSEFDHVAWYKAQSYVSASND